VAVDGFCGIVVAANIGAGQRESGKGALGARVGEDLGIQLPVGIGGSMAPNRSGCRGGVPPSSKLLLIKCCIPSVALDDHDQIDAFDADLQSPASAGDGKERRSAPSVCGAAGGNAACHSPRQRQSRP
jgi:hypothetical protein